MIPGSSKLFNQASQGAPRDPTCPTTHSASSVPRPMTQPQEPATTSRHDDREQEQEQFETVNPLELVEGGEGSEPLGECWTASEGRETDGESGDTEDTPDTEAFVNAYGETMIARHYDSYRYW
ncbi:hypothetical protein CDD82_2505 [Ophiocordyceps australis]|uniref:Uncharacterized protein n=1 Tax=Ophiocordyceps australis TaxID=1399860 RepID=A0A2C5XE64_9HYPO|nr:hypothetical protein CDD82_2505 [Ophiocordyceps australis]